MTDYITLFPSMYANSGLAIAELKDLISLIRLNQGLIREKTLDIQRNYGNSGIQQKIKKTLPVVIGNGVFTKRKDNKMTDYGRHIVIDLDYKIPEEKDRRDADWTRFLTDPLVTVMFHSPRGGIKIIIKHSNIHPEFHAQLYDAVGTYLGVSASSLDPSCKNLSRAHYISYDPDLHFNDSAEIFQFTPPSSPTSSPQKSLPKVTPMGISKFKASFAGTPKTFRSPELAIRKAQEWSDTYFPVCRGFRSRHVYRLACLLHDWGISEKDALEYLILKYTESDFTGLEIEAIVGSAYQ